MEEAMPNSTSNPTDQRIALVTGGNSGTGFAICKLLASNGIMVILTPRSEKKGVEAVRTLEASGHSDLIFHQLDVTDASSIAHAEHFVRNRFGKLHILVNNAAIMGAEPDLKNSKPIDEQVNELENSFEERVQWVLYNSKQTYKAAKECMETNYYGAKHVVEAFLPLLQVSSAARIVNVSPSGGLLKFFNSEELKQELNDIDNLTEGRLDELIRAFLEDFKNGSVEARGWPTGGLYAYSVAKAAMNAYTRVLARRHPAMRVNCVCPGFTKTGMGFGAGLLPPEEGARGPVMLALLPDAGPTGRFFSQTSPACFVTGSPVSL